MAKTLENYFEHGDVYRDIPGTVTIFDGEDDLPSIICLYGQFSPGKSGSNYNYFKDYPDGKKDRLRYFGEGLYALLEYFGEECPFIAVPFMIGCGLAGGNWSSYLALLQNFHSKLQENGGGLVFYKI